MEEFYLMNRVLYLSYDGMTDPLGKSQVIPYLEGLAREGFDITLLSCEKKIPYQKYKEEIAGQLKKAGIKWKVIHYSKSPPTLSTVYDLFKMRKKAYVLHKKEKFQIIHCRSYIPSIVGLAMKRKFKAKFLFDMRGFWADERVDGRLWDIKNPLYKIIYRYFKQQEKAFLENADAIVSLTHHAKDEMMKWKNIKINSSIHVIPCCVDLDLFNRDSVDDGMLQTKKEELEIQSDDFILTYLGAIGTWYMLDEMLDFFKILLKTKPKAKFLFISPEQHSVIQKAAKNKNISTNSILVYKAERTEVPLLLSLSHLSIFFIKPTYSKKASSPTKQGELMAMGIPIICNAGIGDTDKTIQKYNAGVIIDKFNVESYKIVIERLEQTLLLNKKLILQGAHQIYSLENGIANYSHVYKQLIDS